MRKAMGAILALTLAGALWALPGGGASPDTAMATHGRICGVVAKGSHDYLVVAKRLQCRRGRKGVRRYLHKRKPLRGFKCREPKGKYAFVCAKRKKHGVKYRAERL